jgi:hypothetical protein
MQSCADLGMEDTKGFVPLATEVVESFDDLTLADVLVEIVFAAHLVTSMRGWLACSLLPCFL